MAEEIGVIHCGSTRRRIDEFRRWEENPEEFEGNKTLTAEEYKEITRCIVANFRGLVADSNLATGKNFNSTDLDLAHQIQAELSSVEESLVSDEHRRPWNASCLEHARQIETVAVVAAEEINKKHPGTVDVVKTAIGGVIHDIGRFASHHPIIHGMAGRQLLKDLGFHPSLVRVTLSHLESGVGPYMIGIDPETWQGLGKNPEELERLIKSFPLEEILVALADVSKKPSPGGIEIVDPVEGQVAASQRKSDRGEEDAVMRIGFVTALKTYLEKKYEVSFLGKGKIIDLARQRFAS